MNYAEIKNCDVANGPGVRVSLFVSGCTHHCKECFNPETWDFKYGNLFDEQAEQQILDELSKSYIKGITLLGGDPMEKENQAGIIELMRKIKVKYPDKDVWCFTGYDFEKDIMKKMYNEWPYTKELLSYIDVLVDGEFILEQKDLNLKFKGSANQRTIDVKKSLDEKKVVLLF